MNIIFFGSDQFALVHLKALGASGYQVSACVTQPDRPQGRGMKMAEIIEIPKMGAINVHGSLRSYSL